MKYYQDNNSKRQKLVRDSSLESMEMTGGKTIDTLEELKVQLQSALLVEHFTIPPYLCALYSIKDGTNEVASQIIRSVAMEEMLHMVMVANIINAIGGTPSINTEADMPKYNQPLPNSAGNFKVNLLKFSKEAINTFLRIEKPAEEGAAPEVHGFHSIGQFYEAIRHALRKLDENTKGGIFIGDPDKQLTSEHYYGSGGKLIAVYCLADAEAVLDEIIGQGEGIYGSINVTLKKEDEFAHYFRFNEIFYERYYKTGDKAFDPPSGESLPVDWDNVYNMEPNPKMENYAEYPWLLEKVVSFNKTYMQLLDNIHHACNGKPQLLLQGIPLMYKLKQQAVELMKISSGNGNYTAGPTFEYIPKET